MKKVVLGFLVIILLLGSVACGEAEESPSFMESRSGSSDEMEEIRHEYGLDKSGISEVFVNMDSDDGGPPPPAVFEKPSGATIPQSTPAPASPVEDGASAPFDLSIERMIVRTGDISLVVEDVDTTMNEITTLADTYDGYVVNSNSWQDGERMMGDISIRVAAEYFDIAIRALRNMAVEVTAETTTGQDVTEEYVDLSARLSNLEASEQQLLGLMEETGNVTEILEVQRELTNTRGEIEKIKGRMQYLEQSSSTSLIRIHLEHSKLSIEFQASSRNVKEGRDIRFYPEISGGFSPYSFEWDFGDGVTTNEDSPLHGYSKDGLYTVTLKVTDDRGSTDTYERESYISVSPGWDAGKVAGSIWNGLVSFGKFLVNVLIALGIFSPVWIVILIILYFTWWRPRKKKKAQNLPTQDNK